MVSSKVDVTRGVSVMTYKSRCNPDQGYVTLVDILQRILRGDNIRKQSFSAISAEKSSRTKVCGMITMPCFIVTLADISRP